MWQALTLSLSELWCELEEIVGGSVVVALRSGVLASYGDRLSAADRVRMPLRIWRGFCFGVVVCV